MNDAVHRNGGSRPDERKPFLLEIGSEELPARFIGPAASDLARKAAALLTSENLAHGELRTLATPRRLALVVEGDGVIPPDSTIWFTS